MSAPLSPQEKTRRVAAIAALVRRSEGAAHQLERADSPALLFVPVQDPVLRPEEVEDDDRPPVEPLPPPHITITISGPPHAGKSVAALPSILWHRALAHLIARGLSVTLVEAEDPAHLAWALMPEEWRTRLCEVGVAP